MLSWVDGKKWFEKGKASIACGDQHGVTVRAFGMYVHTEKTANKNYLVCKGEKRRRKERESRKKKEGKREKRK